MPTLDLDILNEDAARAIEELTRERYEERGRILVRIGKVPKRAIPFRTDEPFAKIIANVVASNGRAEKIEFLGDGQQVVAFGTHPETKQRYNWHGGEPGQIARVICPHICEDEARNSLMPLLTCSSPNSDTAGQQNGLKGRKETAMRVAREAGPPIGNTTQQHPQRATAARQSARSRRQACRLRHGCRRRGQSTTRLDASLDRGSRWAVAGAVRRYPTPRRGRGGLPKRAWRSSPCARQCATFRSLGAIRCTEVSARYATSRGARLRGHTKRRDRLRSVSDGNVHPDRLSAARSITASR